MKTLNLSIWAILLFAFLLSGCEKDDLLSQSNDDALYALSEKEQAFFDLSFAVSNHADLSSGLGDRSAGDWLDKLHAYIMAQNQEHRFVPALVDRVGYPVWSAAVLSDLPGKPDGKLLLIPFVKFDESEVQAVLSAIFTSEEEDPYILLGEKSALLSLIPYVPEEQLGHTKLSVLATLLLDDELFSHTDETLLAWIKGQLAESDDDDFMDDLDFRCLGVVVIDICGPINTTIQVLKEDEIEVRFDCVSYTVDLGCGGGGGSWWGSTPSSGNGGSNPDGGIFTGGGTPSGPLSNAGSISLSGFNGISNLHELLKTCAVSGEGHEPGHNAELGGVCDGLNQILDVFGLEDIGWLLNSRRDLFDQLSAWLKLNDDALSHQAAWSYVRYVQSGGTLPFREFAGPFISITSWAAEVGITLDDDQFGWLLENVERFEATKMFFQATNFDADAIKSFQWTIAADLAGVAGLDDLYSEASMAILIEFTDCCPDGIDDYDGWTNVPNGQAYMEELEDEMLMLKQLHPDWPDFLIRHWAQFKLFKEDIHTVLDACGLVEGLGAGCDLANGIFYAIEGNGTDASLSFLGALPGGFYVTGTRVMRKAVKINGKVRRFAWRESGGLVVFSHASSYREVWKGAYPALNSADNIAHHVIPKAFWDHPLVQKAAKANPEQAHPFHMNIPSNGWPVHQSRHTSNHSNYSTQIENRMQEWFNANLNATPEAAAEAMARWQDDLKALMGTNPSGPNINTLIIPSIQ